jgi:hypothetical protein
MSHYAHYDKKRRGLVRLLCFASLILVSASLSAQTAAELEIILESPALNCSQAARFVLAASADGTAAAADTGMAGAGAFEKALANGWFPRGTGAGDPLTLGVLSFLAMRAFGIKGGFMYALLPGPRYAFRTMVSRSFIQGAADPAMTVSGERFLLILGNVLSWAGDGQ